MWQVEFLFKAQPCGHQTPRSTPTWGKAAGQESTEEEREDKEEEDNWVTVIRRKPRSLSNASQPVTLIQSANSKYRLQDHPLLNRTSYISFRLITPV